MGLRHVMLPFVAHALMKSEEAAELHIAATRASDCRRDKSRSAPTCHRTRRSRLSYYGRQKSGARATNGRRAKQQAPLPVGAAEFLQAAPITGAKKLVDVSDLLIIARLVSYLRDASPTVDRTRVGHSDSVAARAGIGTARPLSVWRSSRKNTCAAFGPCRRCA